MQILNGENTREKRIAGLSTGLYSVYCGAKDITNSFRTLLIHSHNKLCTRETNRGSRLSGKRGYEEEFVINDM